ncbi:nucleotide exchange factor GrpE [Corynebacterium yudongzhengii]|uniref:Protein GrpE n=1 Tax=Corynebacterium yudongzhengii TaxID=2080740 RepID=A0A2U1T4N1_9CORY|nr:nucleotide exchange factor GrpE [Corynebacterium yudongzhengii]AWB82717.1 nucleotide exchange factor GrpE [Corynebacterium yudongzhengii]PWC00960.1 nucleotide exchange factor GrpE [Corynebacterium yudongzhengii]
MTSPTNPGDPENTDEQNVGPDAAEELNEEAADAQGVDGDDATATPTPDPHIPVDGDIDPTVEADVDAALADVDEQSQVDQAAADAQADEAVAAADAEVEAETPGEPSLEEQLAERTSDLQRVSAEYANYRRRTEREREQVIANAKASVMSSLLPILDDLELARQHGDLDEGPLKGFGEKLINTLEGQKLAPFGSEGEAFDPEIHEAVQDLSTGDEKTVGTVLRPGYRVGERVIRTAMVIIADPDNGS